MLATLIASLLVAPTTLSLTVGGVMRTAVVYAPTGDGPFPVVIGFHGHGGSGRNVSRNWGLTRSVAPSSGDFRGRIAHFNSDRSARHAAGMGRDHFSL